MNLINSSTKEKIDWFDYLKNLASLDLSTAHIEQHQVAAENAIVLANIATDNIGAYSTYKKIDTAKFSNNTITGEKFWVSNLNKANYAVLHTDSNNGIVLVYVDLLDPSITQKIVPVVGMEATVTGTLLFNNTPCTLLFQKNDTKVFQIENIHSHAFFINHLGLANGIYNDIKDIVPKNICRQISLKLSVMELLAKNVILDQVLPSDIFWHQRNTMYAFAKSVLVDLIHIYTQFETSSIFITGSTKHQRYKDLLIYSTHMKNLNSALQEILY